MNKKIVLLWGLLIFLIGVSIITNEYPNLGNSERLAIKNEITEEDRNDFKLEPPRKAAGANYDWTWMSGNKTGDENGIYGTKGVPDRANYPGARSGSVSWTDMDGNFWLFGGGGFAESGGYGQLNDLWRFNLTSKEWAWMSGNKTINVNGTYGTKEVPDRANYPGARSGSVSWMDTDENLWLFGGYGFAESGGYGRLNDLWRFDITSKEWAWMSGNKTLNQNGVYGTKGVPDRANYPGSRSSSVSWMDTDGNLWLFGGYGYNETGSVGELNDLWRFNSSSKEWTWMSGNKTTEECGVYGTKGVPDIANYPGARYASVSWTDTDGNLWLFGGSGYIESGFGGYLNDLWRFSITSKEWAWMSGNKTMWSFGVYGTKGVPDIANYPGGREASISWTDTDGNLWLFGGYGFNEGSFDYLNDLWKFDITSKEWAWMSGSKTLNQYGVYGTKGVPDTANYPGARTGSVSWMDTDGNLWLFGGYPYAESGFEVNMNDLWRFQDCIAPYITIIEPRSNKLFNATAPSYNLTFIDAHLNDTWYRLWNGTEWSITYTIPGIVSKRTGQINQDAWNNCPNGTVIIEFYANDTYGNLRVDSTSIRKDILGPIITINDPVLFEIFSSTAPGLADCDVIFSDVSGIDARWYMLINGTDSNHYTENYTWNGEINQTAWNQMGNGTVIIRIFANDSLGKIGMAEVTVLKNIVDPLIFITQPDLNDIFGKNTMNFTISVLGDNLDTIWYMLINGTNSNDYTNNFTYSKTVTPGLIEDKIQYNLWNQFENGTVIIRFFLNRTNGLMGSDDVLVRKDNLGPLITINAPTPNKLFSLTAPGLADCDVIFSDVSGIDAKWYMLINATDSNHYTENYTWNDEVDQFVWDYMDNGFVIIRIFANDSLGNIGMAEVTVRKDIGPKYYWSWMLGNKIPNQNGVYGTRGVPDMANYPGARFGSVSWTDMDGNFWLFGGGGYAEIGSGSLNDLWRFNITSKEWAWMSGSKIPNQTGFYGMKGVPDVINHPGARNYSVSWTDTDGNLWLFGGWGYNESGNIGWLNDLWKFDIISKEWAWMSGGKNIVEYGVYGTKGVPDITNCPGGRFVSVSWTDTDGNLWLFGGLGYAESGGPGILNDLWRFDISSREWAWMSGNKTASEYGVYGTKGVPDMANYPGGRGGSVSWTDMDGNLWLFGGSGCAESGSGQLNDLWRFNITSKEWAWISGNKTTNQDGVYGTMGVPDMANYPGGRDGSVSWMDTDGNLWLFGGGNSFFGGDFNDLWRFDITSKEWAWMSGNNTTDAYGVYGTMGVPDIANYPGARSYSVSWTDTNGNLWLFGGDGYAESGVIGYLNDLWRLSRSKDSIAPYITIIEPKNNKLLSATAPSYKLTIIDIYLDDTWYRLWNGTEWSINYTIPGIGLERTGQINQNAWNNCPNGTVIIEFYANDTFGNLRMNSTTIRKDILGPLIVINDPDPNDLFNSTAPGLADCDVIFKDVRGIDAQWYMLINRTDNTDYTDNYTWNGKVNQTVWNQMSNGTIIIRIFANDSLGYIGMAEVIVRKDIIAPEITIIKPIVNQSVYSSPPKFIIIVFEANNDTMWYRLFNGTDYTENRQFISNDTIDEEDWKEMWNSIDYGKVITIIFYCNDTVGNIGFANVTVIKSQFLPIIPTDGDDDDDGKKPKEGFVLVEFLTSPIGLTIIGVSGGAAVAGIIIIKKRIAGKKRIKEIRRIERLGRE